MIAESTIVGNQYVTQRVAQLLSDGGGVHAVLLTGPESVGKTHLVTSLQTPLADLHYMSSMTIKQVRWLQSLCSTTPASGRRIIILERVDQWSKEVANAMLKLLEEPRKGTVFALTAVSADAVLPTVRSRCMEVRCKRASDAQMQTLYTSLNIESEIVPVLTYADGRPGRLISYASSEEVRDLWLLAEKSYKTLVSSSLVDGFVLAKQLGGVSKKSPAAAVRLRLVTLIGLWESRMQRGGDLALERRHLWLSALIELRALIGANVQPQRALEWFVIQIRAA